ncbi:hypothetical protein SDC9_129438 [bioreactor metagenome]|uniref:Major facilitator superfamily (MFS) profile domain-containing protein n=1 Tax=bioreactor metagenome TaxID=1076179 RepID=A0A645CZM0_9ZZZZ
MLNIILLGLVSFFSDISSEMAYPLIPLYLTSAFGATPVLIGIIEGIAESLASLLKVFSGHLTDKYNKKKSVAFVGYAAGLIYKIGLVLSASWAGVLIGRIVDRVGKGIRTAPRDVLVAESTEKGNLGKSFGIHKAMDMAGSAAGILMSFFLITHLGDGVHQYKEIFLFSGVFSIIGLIILLFVKEKKQVHTIQSNRITFIKDLKKMDHNLKFYLLITLIFTLGNSSNSFILLRAKNIGFKDNYVILLYFIYNITAAIFAIPFGKLSDKIGRKKVLILGYLSFSLVYAGFAFSNSKALLIAVFVLYGFYTALITGAERAMIVEISPPELKGTFLGLHATIVGIALLPASIIAGVLWHSFGPSAPFILGALLSFTAAILLLNIKKNRQNVKTEE